MRNDQEMSVETMRSIHVYLALNYLTTNYPYAFNDFGVLNRF